MGPTSCPETSVTNDQPAQRNIAEERRYQEWFFLVHWTLEIEDYVVSKRLETFTQRRRVHITEKSEPEITTPWALDKGQGVA